MAKRIESFRDLRVWQAAFALSVEVYRLTAAFPKSEQFALTSQLRRSSIAVPSNIAEGYGRGSRADYLRFLKIARGSLYEMETQLRLAEAVGFAKNDALRKVEPLVRDCAMLLAGLVRRLEQS
ncbi:MAG TPA: four helix bundle protein [Phycisphaerales bacterium]|nr:four helix bundle protein [Phycisphaerales bacterium]